MNGLTGCKLDDLSGIASYDGQDPSALLYEDGTFNVFSKELGPFTPVVEIPSRNDRWVARKSSSTGATMMVLAAITGLKKLCNHPKLIHDMISAAKTTNKGAAGFESCADFFGDGLYDCGSRGLGRERGGGGLPEGWELHSGKFAVLARLLAILRKETKDRVVIISNYTQTLDLIQTLRITFQS